MTRNFICLMSYTIFLSTGQSVKSSNFENISYWTHFFITFLLYNHIPYYTINKRFFFNTKYLELFVFLSDILVYKIKTYVVLLITVGYLDKFIVVFNSWQCQNKILKHFNLFIHFHVYSNLRRILVQFTHCKYRLVSFNKKLF